MRKSNNGDYLYKQLEQFYWNPAMALWRAVEAELVSKIHLEDPVLDIGCGDGSFIEAAFPGRVLHTGLDINPLDIEKAKKKKIYKNLALGDARKMSYVNSSFQTIFSNCVFEHIEGIDKVLKESNRVLKPGGKLVITTLTDRYGEGLFYYQLWSKFSMKLAKKYVEEKNERQSHFNYFSSDEWTKRMKKAGFSSVEFKYYMPFKTERRWDFIDQIFVTGWRKFRVYKVFQGLAELTGKQPIISLFYWMLKPTFSYKASQGEPHGAILLIATK